MTTQRLSADKAEVLYTPSGTKARLTAEKAEVIYAPSTKPRLTALKAEILFPYSASFTLPLSAAATVTIAMQPVTLYTGLFSVTLTAAATVTIATQSVSLVLNPPKNVVLDAAAPVAIAMQPVTLFYSGFVSGVTIDGVLSDSFTVHASSIFGWGLALRDTLNVTPTLSKQTVWTIIEDLLLTDTFNPTTHFGISIHEVLTIAAALIKVLPVTVSETLNITNVLTAMQAVHLAERLLIAPTMVPEAHFGLTIVEALRLSEPLFGFFKDFELSDSFTLHPSVAAQLRAGAIVTEHLNISLTDTHQLLISALLDEELEIADAQVLSMIFNGQLADTIEMRAAYVSPGGTLATWVMNTRNSAVTEYQNYGFNSFAKLGNKYIGASRAGLYELDGPTDDGADLTWHLKSGFTQFNGSRRNGFKAIYLAMRGEGDYVLKLDTADGKHYGYKIRAHDGATTKIPVGKGLQARYWSFELIGIGARSELDGLEFVPLRMNRRV